MKMNKSTTETNQIDEGRCTNLDYLNQRTKSNPLLIEEMLRLYIEQIPPILDEMNKSLAGKDWAQLRATIHKLIPSFSIVGIDIKYENMAKMIQDCASMYDQTGQITGLVQQLDAICRQACKELEKQLNITKYEKS